MKISLCHFSKHIAFLSILGLTAWGAADQPFVEAHITKRDELRSVTSVTISPDGQFLYAAAFNPGNVLTFKRAILTGALEYQDLVTGDGLKCAVSVSLSSDGNHLLASSFRSNSVTLMKRDSDNGGLSILDSATEGQAGVLGLNFAIDATFNNDGRFAYTAGSGGVSVFSIDNGRMTFIEFQEAGGRLKAVRDVKLSPNGKWLYAPACNSGTLGVFKTDESSGKLELVQLVENEAETTRGIAGAFRVEASRDGKHVYLSSGRFNGDQAVSAFEVQPDGKLKQIQVFDHEHEHFGDFKGGNSLALSPDQRTLVALASVSDRLFRFERDPADGRLKLIAHQDVGAMAQPGSAGVCFSPDGKFLYVADENSSSIVAFRTD